MPRHSWLNQDVRSIVTPAHANLRRPSGVPSGMQLPSPKGQLHSQRLVNEQNVSGHSFLPTLVMYRPCASDGDFSCARALSQRRMNPHNYWYKYDGLTMPAEGACAPPISEPKEEVKFATPCMFYGRTECSTCITYWFPHSMVAPPQHEIDLACARPRSLDNGHVDLAQVVSCKHGDTKMTVVCRTYSPSVGKCLMLSHAFCRAKRVSAMTTCNSNVVRVSVL